MDNKKLEKLLNALLEEAALGGFSNFLEENDITEKEYDAISKELERNYQIKLSI